jgi:hypothetical protein
MRSSSPRYTSAWHCLQGPCFRAFASAIWAIFVQRAFYPSAATRPRRQVAFRRSTGSRSLGLFVCWSNRCLFQSSGTIGAEEKASARSDRFGHLRGLEHVQSFGMDACDVEPIANQHASLHLVAGSIVTGQRILVVDDYVLPRAKRWMRLRSCGFARRYYWITNVCDGVGTSDLQGSRIAEERH